jgi:hypothetical protein
MLRDNAEHGVGAATDEYGRMGLLDVRGTVGRLVQLVVLAPVRWARPGPEQLDDIEGFIQALDPLGPLPEVDAVAAILSGPARADTQLDTPVRDVIDGGDDLCENGRVAIRVTGDVDPESNARCGLGDSRERGPGFELWLIGGPLATSESAIQNESKFDR